MKDYQMLSFFLIKVLSPGLTSRHAEAERIDFSIHNSCRPVKARNYREERVKLRAAE